MRHQPAGRDRLADELAELKAEIKALRTERDNTAQVKKLERDVEALKLEKGRLTEANDRKIRETEHKVGLLKTKQDHDVEHATRMAKLGVREANLTADRERFQAEMDFQREHLQREVDRVESILGKVLERLPNIDAALKVGIGTSNGHRSRDADLD
jgi:multidrug efflux pump subunit AcrA (membrane-fusion protein)